jgi:hypothetical protein
MILKLCDQDDRHPVFFLCPEKIENLSLDSYVKAVVIHHDQMQADNRAMAIITRCCIPPLNWKRSLSASEPDPQSPPDRQVSPPCALHGLPADAGESFRDLIVDGKNRIRSSPL